MELSKVENARIEVKMDEHDWHLANPGQKGGSNLNYVLLGIVVVGVAAGAYYKFKVRK